MSFSSDLDRLVQSGQWTQAIEMLRLELSCGEAVDADRLHAMGRLYQRLGVFARAERAYLASLRMDAERALTCNNLALLALHELQPARADQWLMQGLALAELPRTGSFACHWLLAEVVPVAPYGCTEFCGSTAELS